jgi:RNA polymerase sigma-70 factor (ECF subfamily)
MILPTGRIQVVTSTSPISNGRFAELYALHLQQVKAFLARAGCESHAIEDLAQETFLRAWNGRSRFSGTVQFRTWVLGIARNAARESWRKAAAARSLARLLPRELCAIASADADTADVVRAAVAQLPPKQRAAITLVYLHGVSQRDAAQQANCDPVAFRRRLANGRASLRALLCEQTAGTA